MNVKTITFLFVSAVSILSFISHAKEPLSTKDIQEARALVKPFGRDLKHALSTSMKSGGPIKALEVCNLQAGPIAKNNSSLSTWDVSRTSLKTRSESNKPDAWEFNVLQLFEKNKAAGEDLKTMEYSEVYTEDGKQVYRYMKPIATAGLCLSCHGVTLANDVKDKVKQLYPNDKATGFTLGDIRGAFSLKKRVDIK